MKKLLFVFAVIAAILGLSALKAKQDANAEARLWADATDSVL
jgi:hypothetical protein